MASGATSTPATAAAVQSIGRPNVGITTPNPAPAAFQPTGRPNVGITTPRGAAEGEDMEDELAGIAKPRLRGKHVKLVAADAKSQQRAAAIKAEWANKRSGGQDVASKNTGAGAATPARRPESQKGAPAAASTAAAAEASPAPFFLQKLKIDLEAGSQNDQTLPDDPELRKAAREWRSRADWTNNYGSDFCNVMGKDNRGLVLYKVAPFFLTASVFFVRGVV